MDSDTKALIIIAIAAGTLLGVLLAPDRTPAPVIVVHADPAAYEIAGLLEEARRITAEAADDAR